MHDDRVFGDLFINNGFYFCLIKAQIDWQAKRSIIKRLARWWLIIDNLNGLNVSITQMHFFGKYRAPAYFDISFIDQYLKVFGGVDIDIADPNTIAQITPTVFKLNPRLGTDFF